MLTWLCFVWLVMAPVGIWQWVACNIRVHRAMQGTGATDARAWLTQYGRAHGLWPLLRDYVLPLVTWALSGVGSLLCLALLICYRLAVWLSR